MEEKLRTLIIAAAAAAFMTSAAFAQSASSPSQGTGSTTGSSNGAVNGNGNVPSSVNASGTIGMVAPSALEKGANSFTEGQARSRIESAGFTNVTGLTKDNDGIWRGTASKDGKSMSVGFDYKGNLAAQ